MPSWTDADVQLVEELYRYTGNMRGVKNALEAGASVDGHHTLPYSPLMVAANVTDGKVVKFLVETGADLELATWRDVHTPSLWKSGSRAVHSAVHGDKVDNLRVLLEAGANPNAVDSMGCTPLMAVFLAKDRPEAFAMVQELLKAGADPGLVAQDGKVALHLAAGMGATHDVLSILISPATLNLSDNIGPTPLCYAAGGGYEGTVSWLLAVGASDRTVLQKKKIADLSSLLAAVNHDQGRVVQTILNEGLEAVGGIEILSVAILRVLDDRKVRLLQMLLAVDEGLVPFRGSTTEYFVSYIGNTDQDNKKAAIRRILERTPACRAQSWAWPTDGAGPDFFSGEIGSVKAALKVAMVRPKNETFVTGQLAR